MKQQDTGYALPLSNWKKSEEFSAALKANSGHPANR
jgi:hypothetical protein